MQIRAMQSGDENGVWRMLEPVFRAGATYAIDADISREDALGYWQSGAATFVSEEDGELLGTFYIRRNQAGGGAHVCNCGYITAEVAQGRGVARAMLERSLIEARNLGFAAMQYNFVLADNIRAIALWERAGFDVIGRIPQAFRGPQGEVDALIMHRFL